MGERARERNDSSGWYKIVATFLEEKDMSEKASQPAMSEEDLDFEKKVSIKETMEIDPSKVLVVLRDFLAIQQRRAEAYSKLKRLINYLQSFLDSVKLNVINFFCQLFESMAPSMLLILYFRVHNFSFREK